MNSRHYLDANATTPPLPEVRNALVRMLEYEWGNPSSQHAEGRAARRALTRAREQVGALLGVPAAWITWTSGGTEAINTWVRGVVAAFHERHGAAAAAPWFVTTVAEHPAVRATLEAMAETGELHVRWLPTDPLGRLEAGAFDAALTELAETGEPVAGAAVIAAHNETGAVQDLDALAEAAGRHGVPLLADGVQWTGKLPVDLSALAERGLQGWPISFHKLGGPKGVGALVAPPGTLEAPLIRGGPQERRRRGGTENVPGIVAAGLAAELAHQEGDARRKAWRAQLAELAAGLAHAWPDADPISDPEAGLPQTLLVRFPGWRGVELAQRLDLDGIAVGTGSACSSGAVRASDALLNMGWDEERAGALVRFSLPPRAADAAITAAVERLGAVVNPGS